VVGGIIMGNKIKTYGLLGVVFFLLVSTLYVSVLLRDESQSAPTTVKKTKAAVRTYTRTLALLPPSPTVVSSPDPTPTSSLVSPTPRSFAAIQNPTVLLTLSPSVKLLAQATSPTAAVSPTEVLLSKVSSASATISPTRALLTTLPSTGWMKPIHLLFVFAFSLIFFSLIY